MKTSAAAGCRRWMTGRSRLPTAALILMTQAACATVTRGTTDEVWFVSDPPGALVHLEPPTVDCTTPCRQELRRKRDYLVLFEKEGYLPAQVTVSPKFAGAGAAGFAGNVILGGLVGMGVDAATGASKVLRPNPVQITLVPIPAPAIPLPTREDGTGPVTMRGTAQSPNAAAMNWTPPLQPAPPPASPQPQCIQPGLVDREICHGRLRIGMTKAESIAVLGTPDGTSRDQLTHRYGDRYLKFDDGGSLLAISDKP